LDERFSVECGAWLCEKMCDPRPNDDCNSSLSTRYWQKNILIRSRKCIVITTADAFSNWHQRKHFYLFVSLKNRRFTDSLLDWFVHVCAEYRVQGYISVVDSPYLLNERAKLGRKLSEAEVSRIFQMASERYRQINRILRRRSSNSYIRLIKWEDLTSKTPARLKEEVLRAFGAKKRFYTAILEQTRQMKPRLTTIDSLERYAQFVLAELPILLYVYYATSDGVVDFYPGENFHFYEEVEQGTFEDELPETTAFIRQGQPLVYVHVE
jgi:hypothetical protein